MVVSRSRGAPAPSRREDQCFSCANPSIRLHHSACTGARMSDSPLAWDDFRLVKSIAEARGLAGAAEKLGVNHSTVFRRLGQIEERLGLKLFERHRTGYVLTTAGEEMAVLAARIDDEASRRTTRFSSTSSSPPSAPAARTCGSTWSCRTRR